MPTKDSEHWLPHYTRRTPHPPRPRLRLDAVERAVATGSNFVVSVGAPLSLGEKGSAGTAGGFSRRARSTPSLSRVGRAVRFDCVVKLILVPSRKDLVRISADLWWQKEDYLQFRYGSLMCSVLVGPSPPSYAPLEHRVLVILKTFFKVLARLIIAFKIMSLFGDHCPLPKPF